MKKLTVYGIIFLALLSLPFWIMACRLVAPYSIADYPPDKTYYATAEIHRQIKGSNKEIVEKWSSWLYVPGTMGNYPYQTYTEDKINEYINQSLAPNFEWGYRNLTITPGEELPTTRNLEGADCANIISPRIFGGPTDSKIIFNTPSDYRYVNIITYDSNHQPVDEIKVPIKYAEMAFAIRPGVPGINNWDTLLLDNHLRFSDIYIELDDFNINVEVDGSIHNATVTDCAIKNIGTVTAELHSLYDFRITDQAKFYMYWNESSGGLLRFCINGASSLQAGGNVKWCGAFQAFTFGMILSPSDLGIPAQLNISLSMPAGPTNADFTSHQPKVGFTDKVIYTDHLPIRVPFSIDTCDHEDGVNFKKLYLIENYQDPVNERLITEARPPLPQIQEYYNSYGQHKITAILYDTDDGYHAATMILDIRKRLNLLTPNGGDCLEISSAAGGREQEITWTSDDFNSDVKIELIYEKNGHEVHETISSRTANDGSFTWIMPYETHNQCRISICDADTGTIADESDSTFNIVAADVCNFATPVTLGHHEGSLECATNNGGTFCQELCVSPDLQPDVWYQYTALCNGELQVNTCGTNDSVGIDDGMDTIISLHTRCPQMPVSGNDVCNDDWTAWPDPPYSCPLEQGNIRDSFASMYMEAGDSVLIRVSRHDDSSRNDDYLLHLFFDPPICPGDMNCDRDIDGEDLAHFSSRLQHPCPVSGPCPGDLNGDKNVDNDDLPSFASSFGKNGCQEIE
jgi:hypothetical protein